MMMNSMCPASRFGLCVIAFLCIFCQGAYGQSTLKPEPPFALEDYYLNKIAWRIEPGMKWEKVSLDISPEERKISLGNLYEEIDIDEKESVEKPPHTGNIFGLRSSLNYYIVGNKGDKMWSVVDSFGEVYMKFTIFYSPDRIYSRQVTMKNFMEMASRMPHVHHGLFIYQIHENGSTMLVRKDMVPRSLYSVEREGYSLWIDPFSSLKLTNEEAIQLTGEILDALAGKRKFGFFPTRARHLEAISKLGPRKRSIRMSLLKREAKSKMAPGICDGINGRGSKLIRKLNTMEIIRQAGAKEKREIFPNISNGIGTLGWIRKNMDVPFEPNARNDETHTNGISGKFTIKQEDQECIVHYMIAHLGSRAEALCSLFAMQCNQYGQRVDVDRIAGMTRVHPGLVGDYDLCVKPILNELGMPVTDSENAWICFVRGNTAVMLKSENMKMSVLPLAKIIDKALKKNIELYETPEVVR